MIADPLDAVDNRVAALLPNVPEGTSIHLWNEPGASWTINWFDFGQWLYPDIPLQPGQGVVFRNPTEVPLTVTFVGEVPQGYRVNPVANGWWIRSSILPEDGRVSADLLLPVMNGDRIQRMINGSYVEYRFQNGAWTPQEPAVAAGESFWTYKQVGFWWSRNYLAWP
jgi:hypothetical protein